jgi:hypothetical protein
MKKSRRTAGCLQYLAGGRERQIHFEAVDYA